MIKKAWLVILLFPILLGGCWSTGRGEKIGTITRLNRQGLFCKTWEGEIIRGGLNTGSGVMGQAFHFTIEDDALAKEVENYMNTQQEVRIAYKMEAITFCRSDSPDTAFLTKIEPLSIVSTPPVQSKEMSQATTSETIMQIIKNQQALIEQNQALIKELAGK